jgi:hypothetical protein
LLEKAIIYSLLGENEKALDILETFLEKNELTRQMVHSVGTFNKDIGSDPRYIDI